ncbi:unnamed protein product [Brugia pahangi]|uniref:Copper transport protein n=1 Tax=Brugia pahangi TaxID=6280 RepID=A0A0N4T840_BRUPA|nr:unnamed protein product [Brugia pahangi]
MSTALSPEHGRLNASPTNTSRFSGFDRLSSVKSFLDELANDYKEPGNQGHNIEIMNKDEVLGYSEQLHHHHMHGMNDELMKHDGGHNHQHGEHTMKMWFHSGYHETILFEFWQIESLYGLLLSCVLIFIMACFYEWIKWFRVYLQLSAARCPPSCNHAVDKGKQDEVKQDDEKRIDCNRLSVSAPLTTTLPSDYHQISKRTTKEEISAKIRFLQLTLAYCLMLIAMTYNIWLTMAVIKVVLFFRTTKEEISAKIRFLQAVLYFVQLTLAYCLMLIAMTYNIWLTMAVIAGAAFGHWLFAILKCFNPQTDDLDTFATDACH